MLKALLRLPAELVTRFTLARIAIQVERDERLAAEMAEWDVTVGDGLTDER